ncbi:hypothetical protein BgiMline_006464 [Biomphalaria glabrata]|nr:hypothetical protein BgiMline_004370 [Biomphalaria glabrata]
MLGKKEADDLMLPPYCLFYVGILTSSMYQHHWVTPWSNNDPPYVLGHVRANHLTKHLAIALRNKVNQAHETSHPSRNVRHPISDGRRSICPRGATLCEQSVP